MTSEFDNEVATLAAVVMDMKGDEEMTLHLEPPFRTDDKAAEVQRALELNLRAKGCSFKTVEVAGDGYLRVSR